MHRVRMGIRPAMGWLALLLFTTTARAESPRDLLKGGAKPSRSLLGQGTTPVTPKTKALPVSSQRDATTFVVVESSGKPRADYEAEIYSGVPLDGSLAKERGLGKGLVMMVFERERRAAFRVARDRIRRVVRLAGDAPTISLIRLEPAVARPGGHVDVLDTDDGVVVVDTEVTHAGMFVTSDVYAFPKNATLEQRLNALPSPARARLREALVRADRMMSSEPKH